MQGGKAQRHIRQHPQRVSGDCAKFNSANEDDYSQVENVLINACMNCSKVPLCKRPLTMAGYASACHGPQGSEEF